MKRWTKYQLENLNVKPHKLLIEFLDKYNVKQSIDLGCGSGNESVYMIKHNIDVLCIDKELNKSLILDRLSTEEQKYVKFLESSFEDAKLPATELITAFFSIPFCSPEYFNTLWNNIYVSLVNGGYFVGQLFGDRDDWSSRKNINTFSKEQVLNYLNKYNILFFEEVEYIREKDNKKWHYFNIIAQKNVK